MGLPWTICARCAPGAAALLATPSTCSPPAWRPLPARSARDSPTPSAWRWRLDPDAPPGTSPFDHHIYVFASDGDIEEGISHEVSSLAAHHKLGNLVLVYDDNRISIEDDTAIAKSEDVLARYAAYGWHTQRVSWRGAAGYREDVEALSHALLAARAHT